MHHRIAHLYVNIKKHIQMKKNFNVQNVIKNVNFLTF